MQSEKNDLVIEAIKGSPAVAGAIASSMTMNEMVMLGTLIYIIIQALYLVRKWCREEVDRYALKHKEKKEPKDE